MKKITLSVILITGISSAFAQNSIQYWQLTSDPVLRNNSERTITPEKYKTFHLSETTFKPLLFSAPVENNTSLRNSSVIIELPLPDGSIQKFRVVEASIMDNALATAHPDIKTFNVEGIDDPFANGKIDWTIFGFHAMIRRISGDFFVDPYSRNSTAEYISYFVSDFKKDPKNQMKEDGIRNSLQLNKGAGNAHRGTNSLLCAGTELRKYRLALACTGEYAIAATGNSTPTTNEILSAVTTSINRVDGIYETELGIRMVLIAGEDSLLFGDPNTDPFDGNDDADILIDESQQKITSIIGSENFDIGHTFSTGGGGLADLGCVCDPMLKASGITGSRNPVGDPYDVDYVAHEIGHQFGGNHTFAAATGACGGNGNQETRVEPGSGITIMAYAGICNENDIAPHSIPYFHTINFDEMMKFSNTDGGNSCAATTSTGNHPPSVTIPAAVYTIPFFTPFTLTGSATDPDNDSLTYSWEESDNGTQGDWNSGTKPFFRSYAPVTSPSRTFPSESIVLQGTAFYQTTIGEYLPSDNQTLNFRLIARDNKMGGGGVCYAAATVVLANAGPFIITAPNTTGITWIGSHTEEVKWDPDQTASAPINCQTVNILISLDSGKTFTTLVANTPNDGAENIIVPTLPATKTHCRIKVESVGNIFFDINDEDFTITTPDGINELNGNNPITIKLQPNPVSDQVQINLSGINNNLTTSLYITDILGKIVFQDVYNKNGQTNTSYDLSFLPKGVYMVMIQNTKQQAVSRLLKQ